MPIKSYSIWNLAELKIPELWSRDGMSVKKSITWSEERTTLLSARLDINIDPDTGYVKAWLEHNLNEVQRWWWMIGDSAPKSDSVDVIGTLYNGSNLFRFVGAKEFANPAKVVFTVTASLILEYDGTEPETSEDWKEVLQDVAAGVAIGGGVYIVGSSVLIGKEKR